MSEKPKRQKPKRRARRFFRALWRWTRRLLLLAALLVAALFALRYFIRSRSSDEEETQAVSRAQVMRGPMAETVYGTGTTVARSQPNVLAQADGTLTELRVSVGDEVKQGDVLAVLTNDELDDTITDLEFQLWDLDDTIAGTSPGSKLYYINAPITGRVMAVYAQKGDDALAVFRREGALAIISTDGRMRVELSDLPVSAGVKLGDRMTVIGLDDGFEAEGTVTELTRQGTQASVTVIDDTLPMDAPVSVRNESGEEIGQGTLVVNKPMAVSAYGGTISSVSVQVGDKVSRGNALFGVDDTPLTLKLEDLRIQREAAAKELADAKEEREHLILLAPCDGVVASLDVAEGDEITNGALIGSILEGEEMNLTIAVDELDVVNVEIGQSAVVTVDALGDAQLPGTVYRISPVGTNSGGVTTYDVELTLDAEGSGVRSGMNATGEITVRQTDSTLYVPVEALMTIGDETYVTVENAAAQAFAPQLGERGSRAMRDQSAADSASGGDDAAKGGRNAQTGDTASFAGETETDTPQTGAGGLIARVRSIGAGLYERLMDWLYDGVQTEQAPQASGAPVRVEVGMQNDDYAEILSGVSEGDVLLYTGSSENEGFQAFGMGGFGMNMGGNMGGARGGAPR